MLKRQEDPQLTAQKRQRRMLALAGTLLTFLFVFSFVQLLVAQGDDESDPQAQSLPQAPAPYSRMISTTAELLTAAPSVERYIAAHSIPAHLLQPANFEESTKTVAPEEAPPGGIVAFTITLHNSGDTDAQITMTDELPGALEFISAEATGELGVIETEFSTAGGVVVWQGTIGMGKALTVNVTARVNEDAEPGMEITNTAEIARAETTIDRSAAVTVGESLGSPIQFLPYTTYGLLPDPGPVRLDVGEPNSLNQWPIAWTPSPGAGAYELEESHSPDFSNPTVLNVAGSQTLLIMEKEPGFRNEYFYRIRSRVGQRVGPWSNVDSVISAYRDDFTDASSGWAIRRTTYIEEVRSFYEITGSRNWLIMAVEDRWDWGITSPLAKAPRIPYVIEYEIQHGELSNLVSHGVVFGGDWTGAACPDTSSANGWYRHEACFNHFYNVNVILYGPLKLLFERIDELVWCLGCGGSPMKRIGDVDFGNVRDVQGVDPGGWNKYRVEVRQDGIKIFAGRPDGVLTLQQEYEDTRWVTAPYFGIFASTDEFHNSVARVEYIQVLPLDN